MKFVASAALVLASAIASQAALVSYTILMPGGGGGGAFDNSTYSGTVGGSVLVPTGSGVATAGIYQGSATGTFVGNLSLLSIPSPAGTMEIYFSSTPFTLTASQFTAFSNTNLWVSLNTTGGTSVVSGVLTPVPEPAAYGAAAALGLAGFALWRRRRAA